MKIHTTQDLNSFARTTSTNMLSSNEIRLNYSEQMRKRNLLEEPDAYEKNISFKAGSSNNQKDILPKIAKRIKDTTSKRASDKKGIMEKVLSSDRFSRTLESILSNEVLTNAGIAFVIGWTCRVPAILSIPPWLGGKNKEDKKMAAAHSGASVTMGVITAALLTLPVSKASKYARDYLYKNLKPELLKKRHPQLDISSIKDAAGKLLDKKDWKNIDGKKFCDNVKTPMTVARPKYAGDIAESTFKSMGLDIDMAANADKAVHEMTLRNGEKLMDVLSTKDMFIAIEEKGMGTTLTGLKDTNFFSLEFIDKDFLAKAMPDLDINTAFVDGKIVHPKNWKTKNGEAANKFDIYISNYLETAESTPVYTGVKRIEKDGVEKYAAYQDNGNGGLGTLITNEMIYADKNIDTANKTINWLVEIATRVPVGLGTVALIPKILNVFDHLGTVKGKRANSNDDVNSNKSEISKNNSEVQIEENTNVKESAAVSFKGKSQNNASASSSVSFKGKEPSKFTKWLGKNYAFKMLNSEKLQKFVENFDKNIKMSMTEAMTILGSFFMSASYVFGTLTNKNFDKDRKTTLATNQTLGFVVPTFLGTYVSSKINPHVKKMTYKFVGEQNQRIRLMEQKGKLTKEAAEKAISNIGKVTKGIPVLASLTVFTFIYRFFTPVAITPVANVLGEKINNRKKSKTPDLETANFANKLNDSGKKDFGKEVSEKLKEANQEKAATAQVA